MGWLYFLIAAALTGGLLWRFGKLGRGGLELAGAALMLALAGYAWQSNPDAAGNPVQAVDQTAPSDVPVALRNERQGNILTENQWLALADALISAGKTQAAVSILSEGTKRAPTNPDIWVGLGNALTVHNSGQLSPAASYAFEKAAQIAPNHPGPPFFLGLGLAQAGKIDEAGEVWRGLLSRAPADAPWRADLETRLAQINQLPRTANPALPPPPDGGSSPPTR